VTIVRDNILVQGLGLPGDVEQTPYNTVIFIQNGTVSSNNIYNFISIVLNIETDGHQIINFRYRPYSS
jgi:hypothetical protein